MGAELTAVIEPEALEALIGALSARGYRVLGPTVREGAIVYDDLRSAAELPLGWTDEQKPGSYRLARREDEARFGYAVGPHSWKQFLFPPRIRLWRARATRARARDRGGATRRAQPRLALFGVRSCELHAIAIQDRVFLEGRFVDRDYEAAARTRSSSPSTASSPAAPASASRWGPARRQGRLRPRADRTP